MRLYKSFSNSLMTGHSRSVFTVTLPSMSTSNTPPARRLLGL